MAATENRTEFLLVGARVYTADPATPWAEAVLIRGNRLAFVGSVDEARAAATARTEEIVCSGGLVLPGFNDSHAHLTMGGYNLSTLDLTGTMDVPTLQARLRRYATENPSRAWIEGWGLPYEPLLHAHRAPRQILDDAVPDRPVYVRAFDAHTAWCNSLALRRVGIERGVELPVPNEVEVDPASGLATGLIKEMRAQQVVARAIGTPDARQRDEMLGHAMRMLNRLGITSVQNMDGDLERLQQYQRLLEGDGLTVRAGHWLSVRAGMPREYLAECAGYAATYCGPWNHTHAIKLFIDGVVESKTAMMLEPYADGTGDVGVPDMDPDLYRDIVAEADGLGLDVATHAIGDRGVRTVLDAYRDAANINSGRTDRRHRIEHIEVIHPDDIPRFARLEVVASMQPLHAAPINDPRCSPWTALVGPQREPFAFHWRGLAESGARLSFGSDWPIVTADVRAGVHAAMTRSTVSGEPPGGWQPQQRVTLAQALDAYTRGAAFPERQEHIKGMLRAGMLADITVLAQDPFRLAPHELLEVPIVLTMVDGRIVYRQGEHL